MKYLLALLYVLVLSTTAFADIDVTGEGTATLTPDMAQVTLAVVTEAKSPVDALTENNVLSTKLYSRLAAFKISATNVQTVDLSIQPVYIYEKEVSKLTGYTVRNQLTITVRDLSILGTVLTTLVEDGANRLGGLQFAASNTRQAMDIARIAAMKDACRKAKILTQTAGAKVGRLISVSESSNYPTPRPAFEMRAAAAGGTPAPTSAGQLVVTVRISVKYDIK